MRALRLDQRSPAFPDGASAASVTAAVGASVDLGRDDADEVASSARAHIIRYTAAPPRWRSKNARTASVCSGKAVLIAARTFTTSETSAS